LNKHAQEPFAITLRTLRQNRHMSQYDLATATGLDRTSISLLERGMRSPTLGTMQILCKALNVSLTSMAALIEASTEGEQ
jgi:transcriptional regulator with XRE-family HTH domain